MLHSSYSMISSPSIHLVTNHVDADGEFQASIHHVDPLFLNLQSESSQESSTDHCTSSNTVSSIGGSSSGSGGGGACNGATGCRGHTADGRWGCGRSRGDCRRCGAWGTGGSLKSTDLIGNLLYTYCRLSLEYATTWIDRRSRETYLDYQRQSKQQKYMELRI